MGPSANIQLPTQAEEERNCTYAMQLMSSSVLPVVLHSTIQLDVFEILAKDKATKLSALEIVSHMPNCKNPDAATMLDRMLYVLASYSLLDCSVVKEENGVMKRAVDYELWNRIIDGPQYPIKKDAKNKNILKDKSEYDKADFKMLGKNAKTKYILICGLGPDEYNKISGCTTAKQIWETLANAYEKNMDTLEKNKGIKDKSIELKESNNVESDLGNKKLTKNFKRYRSHDLGLSIVGNCAKNVRAKKEKSYSKWKESFAKIAAWGSRSEESDDDGVDKSELMAIGDSDMDEKEVKSEIDKKFKDLEYVMNDRFSEVLKSLQVKNEIVEKSRQEGDPSDDIVDVEGPTSIDSLVKETDKPVEMEEDKANQAPSPFKNGEQHEKDGGIEKLSDIVIEEMEPLDSITSGREHDMKDLKTQNASARTDMEISLINTIKGLSIHATLESYKGKTEQDPFQVEYVSEIAQQDSGSLDCGVFVAVYAEYLSKELGIPYSGIDAQYHRLRYATLLCKYGSEKAENSYFSENEDPPRPRSKFTPKEINCVLHIK
ncbi:putative cellulose synthase A catalytic subunit 2 [UDP-forming] [Capsicum annuum]|nr:putative cellulose synthase A catalytic subunit 2 [UDP-forming] [Capsicum annuum]